MNDLKIAFPAVLDAKKSSLSKGELSSRDQSKVETIIKDIEKEDKPMNSAHAQELLNDIKGVELADRNRTPDQL